METVGATQHHAVRGDILWMHLGRIYGAAERRKRSPASPIEGQKVEYVAPIRMKKFMEYPLMGVIKVELPILGGEPPASELVTKLSNPLLAAR